MRIHRKGNKSLIQNLKQIHDNNSRVWYYTVTLSAVVILFLILSAGVFLWQVQSLKDQVRQECDYSENILDTVESQCSRQVREIYQDPMLQEDFWKFWNNSIEGYMESRLDGEIPGDETDSFPEYMNKFITDNQKIYDKIYFVTAYALYELEVLPDGGGGEYKYHVPYSEYVQEVSELKKAYVITAAVQDINKRKNNAGKMVFLVNYDYLYKNLAGISSDYMILHRADRQINLKNPEGIQNEGPFESGIWWVSYESGERDNVYRMGFHIMTILRACWPALVFLFLLMGTVAVCALFQVDRFLRSNTDFLKRFTDTIQLAKQGIFQQVDVGGRKDNYGLLAEEINDMIVKLDLHIKKEYLLKIRQQETEMKAMLYQINPHFLYNTLEIIRAQASMQKNYRAADALFDLGSMYRMLVKLEDVISMDQELQLLTHYLNIMDMKHQDNFYYEIDVDEAVRGLDTVKFWLQPLAENYFVHGYDKNREFNLFAVQGRIVDKGFCIRILDNGKGMEEEEILALTEKLNGEPEMPEGHIGLRNVCGRLRYFYKDKMTVRLYRNEPRGLCIEIVFAPGRSTGNKEKTAGENNVQIIDGG